MANLVVCCDGTWNEPDGTNSTNVVYAYDLCVPRECDSRRIVNPKIPKSRNQRPLSEISDCNNGDQLLYYQTGVGTSGSWLMSKLDGATGTGIRQNIIHAYRWIATNYNDGDRIFLFGFSRGAFAARSLGGMIVRCGLLYPDFADEADNAFELYRDRDLIGPSGHISGTLLNGKARLVDIHFIGVWDTVGALGVPILGREFNFLSVWRNQFHDVTLSSSIRHAYHALAMDEMRPSFVPTLWQVPADRPKDRPVEQVWFRGVHSDIGGGYGENERTLADIALRWMMEKAQAAGLLIDAAYLDKLCQSQQTYEAVLHNSLGRMWRALGAWPRGCPIDSSPKDHQDVRLKGQLRGADTVSLPLSVGTLHPSVHVVKIRFSGFDGLVIGLDEPICKLDIDGKSETRKIYSTHWWNRTGIALEAGGHYAITCEGTWRDLKTECDANGWERANLLFKLFKRFRRKADAKWFAAIGVINNHSFFRSREESVWKGLYTLLVEDPPELNERQINLGESCIVSPSRDGLLHCFANDLWWMYNNNTGHISLSVSRIAQSAVTTHPTGLKPPRPSVDSTESDPAMDGMVKISQDGQRQSMLVASTLDERRANRLGQMGFWYGFLFGILLAALTPWGKISSSVYTLFSAYVGGGILTGLLGWWIFPLLVSLKRTTLVIVAFLESLLLMGLALVVMLTCFGKVAMPSYVPIAASWLLIALTMIGVLLTIGILAFAFVQILKVNESSRRASTGSA